MDDNTKAYEISNTTSGQSLGLYLGTTQEEAIAAMLADANHDGPADPDLRARELDGVPLVAGPEGGEILSTERGKCDVCGRAGWLSDWPEGEHDVLVADHHVDGRPTCGSCASELDEI